MASQLDSRTRRRQGRTSRLGGGAIRQAGQSLGEAAAQVVALAWACFEPTARMVLALGVVAAAAVVAVVAVAVSVLVGKAGRRK